jgi:phage shock protein PspC (stress-responsive transcriptional regulator)
VTPQHDPASPRGARTVRLLFAVLALASLAIGLALYAFAERLGLDADTARYLVTAFLATAMADALILYVWDRFFTRKP